MDGSDSNMQTNFAALLGRRKYYYCTAWFSEVIYIVYLIMLLVSTLSFSLVHKDCSIIYSQIIYIIMFSVFHIHEYSRIFIVFQIGNLNSLNSNHYKSHMTEQAEG